MIRTSRLPFFLLVVLFALSASLLFAAARDQPPPLPGWTHSPRFADDTPEQHGIKLTGSAIFRASPVIAEVDGNSSNGKEVVIGGNDGRLYTYGSGGNLLWTVDVMPSPCTAIEGKLHSKPAVGPIYGGTKPYVVVGYGSILTTSNCNGGVAVYDGSNGSLVWRYSLADVSPNETLHGVLSSPSIADTDGDGTMEIGFGGFDRNIHLLNHDGSVRWYYHTADTIWSSPAFMNIDNDAELEMIIGSDISKNDKIEPPTEDGGYVYAFDTQPRNPPLIPFQTGYIWKTTLEQGIYSSPAVGDVLASNAGDEIVIGSSCFFPRDSTNKVGKWVKVLRPSDGNVLKTLNAHACVQSSPALGDINDDGTLEIVATVSGSTDIGGDGKSRIVAWNATNPNPIWSTIPTDPNSGSNDAYGGDIQSPVIADLDGNGTLEVVAANFWSVHVLRGSDGTPLTCQNPSCGSKTSLFAWSTLKSTPAIGDINNDGVLDLVIGGGHMYYNNGGNGMLYAWTNFNFGSETLLSSGTQEAYSAPWPQFRMNEQNSGNVGGVQSVETPTPTTPPVPTNTPTPLPTWYPKTYLPVVIQ